MKNKKETKPLIETLINTSALTLISYGVLLVTLGNPQGYIPLTFGFVLEAVKYIGRKREYW